MKKLISIMLVSGALLTSCGKFFDVNTDPNNPSTAGYEYVFPAAVTSSAAIVGGQYAMLGSLWSQHFTQKAAASQYRDLDSYDCDNNKFPSVWTEAYAGALNDYSYIIREAAAAEDWATNLMAVAMRCYTFAVMADLYDTVPYSEALQGADEGGTATPKFDNGQDIYDGLIAELDAALAAYAENAGAATNTNLGASDFVFKGDIDKWIQFVNTLKLKLFLRQVNARPEIAQQGVTALYNAGANFLAEPAAMSGFANEDGKYNPLYGNDVAPTALGDTNLRASKTLLDYLTNNSDSRADKIYKPAPGETTLIGQLQGDFDSDSAIEVYGKLAYGNWSPVQPVYFFTEAEVYFLQAEALSRYSSLSGNAQQMYEAGVKASFNLLGADGADALLAGAYSYTAAEDKIQAIITQKWISQAKFNPIESFFDFNRTGYPDFFTISVNSVIGNLFPKRLLVSDTDELSNNPENCPTGFTIANKVWWAK